MHVCLMARRAAGGSPGTQSAQDAKPADKPAPKITYDEHVRPIFREHCFSCHSQGRSKSDLALDSYAATMRGGASGEVVLAGDLDSSRLCGPGGHAEEPKMPPEQDKLPEAKLAIIKKWIAGGALENAGSTARPAKKPKLDLTGSGGFKKPAGPPPMPDADVSKRARRAHGPPRRRHGAGGQPVGAAGGRRRPEADSARTTPTRRAARRAAVPRRRAPRAQVQPQRLAAAGRRRPRRLIAAPSSCTT